MLSLIALATAWSGYLVKPSCTGTPQSCAWYLDEIDDASTCCRTLIHINGKDVAPTKHVASAASRPQRTSRNKRSIPAYERQIYDEPTKMLFALSCYRDEQSVHCVYSG